MGEKLVKPIHNVYQQYRKMNLVNPYWYAGDFTSTWKTDNTSAGSSTSTQVKLPLISTGTYNFVVDWGDGNSSTITAWNIGNTHTYASAGTYTIKIKGTCIGWQFNNLGDRLKILTITKWGKLRLGTTQGNYFYGCANLNLSSVTDVLDLTGTTSLSSCFRDCTSISTVGRINEWNTLGVTTMDSLFRGAIQFNSSIENWNVSSVTNMSLMFSNATVFNQPLNSWNTSAVVLMNEMFSRTIAGTNAFNQPLSSWNTSAVTNMSRMFGRGSLGMILSFNQNIGAWNVSNVANFSLMFVGNTVFNNGGSSDINNWTLKTTGTVDMNTMFAVSTAFNQPLNLWNTVAVTSMSAMFQGATSFNQNIGSWNVSSVTSFSFMFNTATAFNNGGSDTIKNWALKTTGTITIDSMFRGASVFNQPLLWNTVAVTNMSDVFNSAITFNQDLGSWNMSNVTTFASMFQGATAFNNGGNSNINNWALKTTGTVIMTSIFQSTSFNQSLSLWNTSAVTLMNNMFYATPFNQNIGAWSVSNVTSFAGMFTNSQFNNGGSSDIDNWTLKTTGTVDMNNMFVGAGSFNQPLSSWNTSAVTNMSAMFQGATSFNQNIGSWNVSVVANFANFMLAKTAANFSTTNLDAIYNGWSNRLVIASLTINFGSIKYTSAATEGKSLLTRANSTKSVTNAANNGSGLIRISATAHGLSTGNKCFISGVLGTTEANGAWIVTVVDANTIDLNGSTFTNTYSSAGTLRTGYGWTITDGGI